MARGGYRVGAGRPRKGENRSKEKPSDQMSAAPSVFVERTPLEHMLMVMNDINESSARRDRMAIAAAPFVHPRAGESGKKEAKAEAAKRAGTGRFAPSAPPRAVN